MGLTGDRVQRWVAALLSLRSGNRLDRRSLESLAGGLQWASAVLPRLRPWLAEFYRCINAPLHAQRRRIRISTDVVRAGQLWAAALQGGPLLRHCLPQARWPGASAADAWAAGDHAGICGWWSANRIDSWHEVQWFSLSFSREDLEPWVPLRGDLRKEIAWLELLAQVVLLVLRARGHGGPARGDSSVQRCDNAATVGACKLVVLLQSRFLCVICHCSRSQTP